MFTWDTDSLRCCILTVSNVRYQFSSDDCKLRKSNQVDLRLHVSSTQKHKDTAIEHFYAGALIYCHSFTLSGVRLADVAIRIKILKCRPESFQLPGPYEDALQHESPAAYKTQVALIQIRYRENLWIVTQVSPKV